jgi:hypothetical protein
MASPGPSLDNGGSGRIMRIAKDYWHHDGPRPSLPSRRVGALTQMRAGRQPCDAPTGRRTAGCLSIRVGPRATRASGDFKNSPGLLGILLRLPSPGPSLQWRSWLASS